MKHIKTYENNKSNIIFKSNIGEMLFHKFFSDNHENITEINQHGHSGGVDVYFIFSETLDGRYFKNVSNMCEYLFNNFKVKKSNICIHSSIKDTVELNIRLEIGEQIDDLEYDAYNFTNILKDTRIYNL